MRFFTMSATATVMGLCVSVGATAHDGGSSEPIRSVAISYAHISDADLGNRDQDPNDIGVRVGLKF